MKPCSSSHDNVDKLLVFTADFALIGGVIAWKRVKDTSSDSETKTNCLKHTEKQREQHFSFYRHFQVYFSTAVMSYQTSHGSRAAAAASVPVSCLLNL